jgi:rod shape-determining protein MreD
MTRVLAFTLVGFAALVLLGPLQNVLGLDMVVLDVPLVIVVYMALADRSPGLGRLSPRISGGHSDLSGGLTALLLGYISDVLGGTVKGQHALALVVVFLVYRRAARHVYLASTMSVLVVTFSASLLGSMMGLGIMWIAGVPPGLGSLPVAGVQALLCAGISPPLIRALRALDVRLARDRGSRAKIR